MEGRTHAEEINHPTRMLVSLQKEYSPPQHLSVVAIEKGAFESPSTTVTDFTFTYLIWGWATIQKTIGELLHRLEKATYFIIFTNLSARAGYDTRSIF